MDDFVLVLMTRDEYQEYAVSQFRAQIEAEYVRELDEAAEVRAAELRMGTVQRSRGMFVQ